MGCYSENIQINCKNAQKTFDKLGKMIYNKKRCAFDGCNNRLYCELNGKKSLYGMHHMKYTVIQLWKNLGAEGLKAFEEQYKKKLIERCDK